MVIANQNQAKKRKKIKKDSELNVDDFYPSYRGNSLRNMPELSRVIVREIGVMISDKKEGEFNLEIDWIKIK